MSRQRHRFVATDAFVRAVLLVVGMALGAGLLGAGLPALAQHRPEGPPARQVDSSGALLPRPDAATRVLPVPAPTPANGQSVSEKGIAESLDYKAWDILADRIDGLIEDPQTEAAELEHQRSQLVDWRAAFLGAQSANSVRIATLRQQIAALGPTPSEGSPDSAEIAERRSNLTELLVNLQTPGIAADEAHRRADGLVHEIDRALREKQADQLLQLWPSPINPANWPDGLRVLTGMASTIWSEVAQRSRLPEARSQFADNFPAVLGLLLLAATILGWGGAWIGRGVQRLQNRASVRGRRIWAFLASLGQIVVPVLGVVFLAIALLMTGMLGVTGRVIAENIAYVGVALFSAIWLGNQVFASDMSADVPLNLSEDQRAEGRFLASSMGLLLGVEALREVAMERLVISEAATAVLVFPVILLAGLLLIRMGLLMGRHVREEVAPAEFRSYGHRVISVLGRGAVVMGIAGPLLAAAGYVSAGSAMVLPAIHTLALFGLLSILQQLVGDIFAVVTRRDATDGRESLIAVLFSFGLTLAALPILALIWGARLADLTELWLRFHDGIQIGDSRISPSAFLFFALVFAVGYGLTRTFQASLRLSILPRTGLDQGGQNAVVSGVGYLGILIAALIAVNSAGLDLSGLAIVAGALSVGIGFGLQNIVSNFVSGIILLIERPVSEGDWIEVGNVQGIVKTISVRSTRIQTFDRSDVIVPNLDLVSGRVTNWTRYGLSGRLIVAVSVPFTSDSRKVEAILTEIAEAQPMIVLDPPPLVVLIGFGPETMNFEIRVILRDVNFSVPVRSEINHQIIKRFAESDIVLSNAHRDYLKRVADELAAENEAIEEARGHEAAVAALLSLPSTSKQRSRRVRKPDSDQ